MGARPRRHCGHIRHRTGTATRRRRGGGRGEPAIPIGRDSTDARWGRPGGGGGRRRGAGPRAGGGHADTRAAEAEAPSTATAAGARGGRLPGPARTACVRTDVHVSRDVSALTHLSVSLVGSCSSRPVARRRAGPTLDLSSHVTQSLTSGHSPSSGSHVSRTRQGTCSVDFGLRAAARAGRHAFPRLFWRKQKSKRSNLYIIHTDHTSETLPRMGRHS